MGGNPSAPGQRVPSSMRPVHLMVFAAGAGTAVGDDSGGGGAPTSSGPMHFFPNAGRSPHSRLPWRAASITWAKKRHSGLLADPTLHQYLCETLTTGPGGAPGEAQPPTRPR